MASQSEVSRHSAQSQEVKPSGTAEPSRPSKPSEAAQEPASSDLSGGVTSKQVHLVSARTAENPGSVLTPQPQRFQADRQSSPLARSPLQVLNLAFCQAVHGFGSWTPWPNRAMTAGETVLLYAEVENFTSRAREAGFYTHLKSRWRLHDSRGRLVAQREFPVAEDVCRNRRRDYFQTYRFALPNPLPHGTYLLELVVEDLASGQLASGSIPLKIRPTTPSQQAPADLTSDQG